MRFIFIALCLLIGACGKPDSDPAKTVGPQREALEKARGVEQTLQKEAEETRRKIDEAEGK